MGDGVKLSEVVISGISGRFPESTSLKEFISNLLENRDLVTSSNRRFQPGLYGLPKGYGTLKELDKFDAAFFGLLPKQADVMDPQLRIGLETTYEAMFDAGVNPEDERGSRTGVFTAIISHEALELWSRNPDEMDGANLIGSLGTMLPNRISYCFDFNGPSASYDTACSSSIYALDAAVTAIQTGKCDSAIVMGACLILNPVQSVMRNAAGMLAQDSVTRSFDSDGQGYVRAEAVASIYLQKMCNAKKAYAQIVGIGTITDGYKESGIFYPSAHMQEKLLEEVYSCAGVDPSEVTYVEAHGTGTPAGDPEEFKAISRHFCFNHKRKKPLLMGTVKSNMGHAEAASGLCSLAKIVAILQTRQIPANLHYAKPHCSMKSIRNGEIRVVDKNTAWSGGYIGLNCFGFGGVNMHVILKPTLSQGVVNGHHARNFVNGHHHPNLANCSHHPNSVNGHHHRNPRNGHDDPNAPNVHGDPNAPNAHGDPNAPNGHGDPNAPNAHGDPNAPNGHGDPNAPNGHGDPNASNGHGDPNAPNGEGYPSAPNGHADHSTINRNAHVDQSGHHNLNVLLGQNGHNNQNGLLGQNGHNNQNGLLGQNGHNNQNGLVGKNGYNHQNGQVDRNGHVGQSGNVDQNSHHEKNSLVHQNCYKDQNFHLSRNGQAHHNGHSAIPKPENNLLQLVTLSGRTQNGLERNIKEIMNTDHKGQLYLLNEINRNIKKEKFRAYGIIGTDIIDVMESPSEPPQVWFVMSGMGSQWTGMGRTLFQIPAFKSSFGECCKALKPFGYSLYEIYFSDDPTIFDTPTNTFTCIGATQIGLIDILRQLRIKPDGIMGHSMGETLCSYADECMTLKETIVSIYLRGKPCEDLKATQLGSFGMAVVSLGSGETAALCPAGLVVACHNSTQSTTISGPLDHITQLKAELSLKGIQVKEVNSCGLAFHSSCVTPAADKFIEILKPILKERARSYKWISTSVPEQNWEKQGRLFGPQYLHNNFLSPVLFTEALKHIPRGAVIIEIGPSGLLRGLIQKGTKDTIVIPLQARNTDPLVTLRNALGKTFVAGINYDLNNLIAAKVELPLPGNTPLLGHLVDWDHSHSWGIPLYSQNANTRLLGGSFGVCLSRGEDSYLSGHVIAGKILYPAGGYLHLVWKYFAAMNQQQLEDTPVVFEDVKFVRATFLRPNERTEFHVSILKASGIFEVTDRSNIVCTGRIRGPTSEDDTISNTQWNEIRTIGSNVLQNLEETQTTDDIYKRLRFLGYEYAEEFKGILKVDPTGSHFLVRKTNWVTFMDTLLQTTFRIYSAKQHQNDLIVPTEILKISIYPGEFCDGLSPSADAQESSVFVNYDANTHIVKCRGVEVEGLKMTKFLNTRLKMPAVISYYAFDPYKYEDADEMKNDKFTPLLRCVSIVMENFDKLSTTTPRFLEICENDQCTETLEISNLIRTHFAMPDVDYTFYFNNVNDELVQNLGKHAVKTRNLKGIFKNSDWNNKKYDLIILNSENFLQKIISEIRDGAFFILKLAHRGNSLHQISKKVDIGFQIIAHKYCANFDVFLFRKDILLNCKDIEVIPVDNSLSFVETLALAMKTQEKLQKEGLPCPRLYLVSNGNNGEDSGILGLTLCLRKEPFSRNVRCIYSKRAIALDFEAPNRILQDILDKDMVFNVIDNSGRLGCYIHSEISSSDRMIQSTSAFAGVNTPGDWSSFSWTQGMQLETLPNMRGLIPVDVAATALNLQVMISASNITLNFKTKFPHCYQSPLGLEFAGTTTSGRNVCGITPANGLATQLLASENLLWHIPEEWTFAEAATVPICYSQAYYALVMRGKIRNNQSLLVLQGLTTLGIAAIRVALSFKCQIFVTGGSEMEIQMFGNIFPEIPKCNITSSTDRNFETLIRSSTEGQGVDFIINSLENKTLETSIRYLSHGGHFFDFSPAGDRSRFASVQIGASYHQISIDALHELGLEQAEALKSLVQEGIESGVVQPLSHQAFSWYQVQLAFEHLGQISNAEKVVILFRESEVTTPISCEPIVYFDPTKSYIILGGLGGVGLELVNWMTLRNAQNILITSRTGQLTPYIRNYIKIWNERGAMVKILAKNAIYRNEAEEILNKALEMAPIGGIFNLTLALDVKLMKFQTEEIFQKVIDPKIRMTQNLDELSRSLCPKLDHFVVFSSVSSGLGFDGQCNYGYANSGAERIIERRVADGYPGRAIQWGPIGEVGAWHNQFNKDFQRTELHGTGVQSMASVLKSLDLLLTIPGSPVTLCRQPINVENLGVMDIQHEGQALKERIAHILGHSSAAKLNNKHKLGDLGMDSLMSIEVVHLLEKEFSLVLSAGEIRGYTLEQLSQLTNKSLDKV